MATTPAAGSAGLDAWPLILRLDQVLERAGLRVAAIHGPGDPGADPQRGRPPDRDPAAGTHPSQPARTTTPRVLLVDDNPAVRRVVLMDWRMPQLDGLQATTRIRQRLPEVQVVMFSSAEGAGQGDRARQAGASTFIAKGAPPEQPIQVTGTPPAPALR